MVMNFEDLTPTVRQAMLTSFEADLAAGRPYRSAVMTTDGLVAFLDLMRDAINDGNETTLAARLLVPAYWRDINARGAHVDMVSSAARLALTEFNTWYVAGLAEVLLGEGATHCRVYRAEFPEGEPGACSQHEELDYPLADVVAGHRLGYWPRTGKAVRNAFSVPAMSNCHHTIGRCKN